MARIQVERGYALSDTLREIQSLLLCMPDLPDASLRYVLKGIAQIEYDLSHETSQQLQVGALVGIFQKARQLAFQAASS